jgi:hypothetical protein
LCCGSKALNDHTPRDAARDTALQPKLLYLIREARGFCQRLLKEVGSDFLAGRHRPIWASIPSRAYRMRPPSCLTASVTSGISYRRAHIETGAGIDTSFVPAFAAEASGGETLDAMPEGCEFTERIT